jgi:hypothetical protein
MALLGAHHILHVSRVRVKNKLGVTLLNNAMFQLSLKYMLPILTVFEVYYTQFIDVLL